MAGRGSPGHEHSWYFVFAPARWAAACTCGLAVVVEEVVPGRATWAWTLHGELPPVGMILAGTGSVVRARRALLAGRAPGRD